MLTPSQLKKLRDHSMLVQAYRGLRHSIEVMVMGMALAGCASTNAQLEHAPADYNYPPAAADIDRRFEALLTSKDAEFERQRKSFFADRAAVISLQKRFDDPDRVVAFISRELFRWANASGSLYDDLDQFLNVTEPYLRKTDKSAKGGGGSDALFHYLSPFLLDDKNTAEPLLRHLLLRALKQPNDYAYIVSMLSQYYSAYPTPEPEVWIRATSEGTKVPQVFAFFAETNLALVEPARLQQALDYEHDRASKLRIPWPAEYEMLRRSLKTNL
jgi:hypothetical protein